MDIKATISALRKWVSPDEPVEGTMAGTKVQEEASKALPKKVMPRKAIETKRKQLKDLDEQTKEE